MLARDWSSNWSEHWNPLTNNKFNSIKNETQDTIDSVLRNLTPVHEPENNNKIEKFQNNDNMKTTCACDNNACYKCKDCCRGTCENCSECPCMQNACKKCVNCRRGSCGNCSSGINITLNVNVMQFILMLFLVILACLQAIQLQKIRKNINPSVVL